MTARKAGVLVLLLSVAWNLQGQFSQGGLTIWGSYSNGATNVPAGLTNVVAISAAGNFTTALRADGTVAEWGTASAPYGPRPAPPAGLNQVVAISTGPL